MESGQRRAHGTHLHITLQTLEQLLLEDADGSHQGLLQLCKVSWELGQKTGPGEGPGQVTKWTRGSRLGVNAWHTAMQARCHTNSIHLDYNVKGSPWDHTL